MSTNALNTSHAGYPTEHTPEARAVLIAALRHEKELAQEGATRSGMDLLDAVRAYRASLAPKPRYIIHSLGSFTKPMYAVIDREALDADMAETKSRTAAEKIAAALNAQEQKP